MTSLRAGGSSGAAWGRSCKRSLTNLARAVSIAATVLALMCGVAWADPPSVRVLTAPLVAPSDVFAWHQGQGATHTDGAAAWSGPAPEIAALARSLGSDRLGGGHPAPLTEAEFVQNVFNYVRNNIEVEFRFGVGKGARGALIDQYGSPFDQAELMVELLRAGGVSAQYQVGTLTLTGRQFGYWSGLVRDLAAPSAGLDPWSAASNPSAQGFNVDARGACQLLADGGVPAIFVGGACAGLSGNLAATSNAVTLGHIWVVVGGQIYDPSLKYHTLTPRMDLPSLMGCGSWASSSSCAQPTNQIVSGATTGTFGGAPSISGISLSNYQAGLGGVGTYSFNLQHGLEMQDRFLQVTDAVGGMTLYTTEATTIAAATSAYTASGGSWSGDVPDSYRTKIVIRTPLFIPCTYFADEIAGRRIVFSGMGQQSIGTADALTCNNVGGSQAAAYQVLIDIDHPYYANTRTYADETLEFEMVETYGAPQFEVDGEGDYWGDNRAGQMSSMTGSFPITIVHGFGAAAASAQQHVSALQDVSSLQGTCQPSDGNVITRTCHVGNAPLVAETLRYQETLLTNIVGGVTRTGFVRHHDIGVIFSSRNIGNSYISMTAAMSIAPSRSDDLAARDRAHEIMGQVLPLVEETSVVIEPFSDDMYPRAAPQVPVSGWGVSQLVEVAPNQMASVLAAMPAPSTYGNLQVYETRRRARLQTAASLGYTSVFNVTGDIWTGEYFYRSGDRSYTLWQALKGANVDDPMRATMNMAQLSDAAAPRRRYSAASPSDGELSFTAPPDIVTGTGAFPYSLSFTRTYVPGAAERVESEGTTYMNGPTQQGASSQTWIYTGPDQDSSARLGGGWTHNFNVTATMSMDYSRALGSISAVEASQAIGTIVALNDAGVPSNLQDRVRLLALRTMVFPAWRRTVVIRRGASTEAFMFLPDGRLSAPPGSAASVSAGGTLMAGEMLPASITYTGAEGDVIHFDDFTRRKWDNCTGGASQIMHPREPLYKAAYWTFPNGVRIDFDYELRNFWTNVPELLDGCTTSYAHVLTRVRNNLGRSLTFASQAYNSGLQTTYNDGGSFGVGALTVGYRITSVTDENNRSATFNVSSCPSGARIVCNVFTATDPGGGVTRYEYEADSNSPNPSVVLRPPYRLRRWFTPEQIEASISTPFETIRYDGMLRVERVTDALGEVTRYYPGAIVGEEEWRRGQIVSPVSTPSEPVVTTNIFDGRNALIRSIDPLGRTTRNEYDRSQRLVRTINPEGDEVRNVYDVRSNLIEVRRVAKPSSGLADIVTTASYAPSCGVSGQPACASTETFWSHCTSVATAANCNRPLIETDGRNFRQRNTWNALGLLTRVETGLNSSLNCALADDGFGNSGVCPQTDLVYTAHNGIQLLTSRTDRIRLNETVTTSYNYNSSNHYVLQSATVDPGGLGLTTNFSFDAVGNLLEINGPRTDVADIINVTWDANRRILMRIEADPDGAGGVPRPAVRLTYNDGGLITASERGTTTQSTGGNFSAAQTTTFTLDGVGRRVRVTTPAGVTQTSYDGEDRVVCTAVRMNAAVYSSLPTSACTLSTAGAHGSDRITRNTYDRAGQLLLVERAVGTSLEQDYSAFTYTLNGQRASVEDANGNRSDYGYDGFDRLYRLHFPLGTTGAGAANPTDYEQYGYDENSNRVSRWLRSGETIAYQYDPLNREVVKDLPGGSGRDVYSSYDLLGRRIYARWASAGGDGVNYSYDRAGRLLSETSYGRALSYQYDPAGNRTRLTWASDNAFIQYTYDAMNRMDRVGLNGDFLGEELIADYGYDSLGRRSLIDRGNPTDTAYAYDGASRLQSLGLTAPGGAGSVTYSFTYNPASQVLSRAFANNAYNYTPPAVSRTYVPNGLNQYSSVSGTSFVHDARGNLTNDGTRRFCYDLENRLTGVSPVGADPCTTPSTLALSYDPLGRLRQTTAASGTRQFLYDGDRLVAEFNGASTTPLRRFVHGAGVDEPLIWYEGDGFGGERWLHADHQGSIIATSQDGGTAGAYAYGPYGEPDPVNGWSGSRFRYTGQIMLPEAQLYHYKARVYDPVLGRFLQTDPIGYEDDLNLYMYVGNDPLNRSDPTGRRSVVRDGRVYIEPEDRSVPRVNLPNNVGAEGFDRGNLSFHDYNVSTPTGMSGSDAAAALGEGLRNNPTPGNDRAASPMGTRNDVGAIPTTDGSNIVRSFSIPTPDASKYTDIVVNYTVAGEHGLHEGFVMRYGEIGDGSITLRSYGEGEAWQQDPLFEDIWGPQVESTWQQNQREIIEDVRR